MLICHRFLVEVRMASATSFVYPHVNWSQTEKKIARKAFDKAYEARCAAVRAHALELLSKAATPSNLWQVDDYLATQRKETDELFDYRYSVLLQVFSALLVQGLLKEADLTGLHDDKIETIKKWARLDS
jgi:hypothetical protein